MDNDDNSIRLAKRVAEMRPCSRREAELYIEGGFVSVDGVITEEPGARVTPEQQITVADDATLLEIVPVTMLLHKPAGDGQPQHLLKAETQTRSVPGKRFLKRHVANLTQVLPLDAKASGLTVFTQDFRVARKFSDDTVEQEIIVEVTGDIIENGLQQLNQINGKVSWQNENRLRFAIKGLKLGLIDKLCKEVGLTVVSMKRIRIGRIAMASLPAGEWRYLQDYERF
ncbi:RNA pseudouridine synthase [Duganella callida]|uniref:RNA pseudouridine synthase n=1 Tax=Duganella callida TaxID=2561932 RepID=UPI002277351F|nr:RNA pseudouridine synthase [Duganella callida]